MEGGFRRNGKTAAQIIQDDREAEELRKRDALDQARRPQKPGDVSSYSDYGPSEVTSRSGGGGSRAGSVSRSYDYTGMDEAAKVSQALQAAQGSFLDVALNDPMRIPTLQNSIRSMQQYLDAYNSGNGLPPVRVTSESASGSSSPSTSSTGYGRKKIADHVLPGDPEELKVDANEVNMIMPAAKEDEPPQQGPPLPGLGGTPNVSKWLMPNQGGLSDGSEKPTYGIPDSIKQSTYEAISSDDPVTKALLKSVPRGKPQEPPLEGLQKNASIWDLEYYV